MADQDFLNAFEDCINRLAEGRSVEDCLRSYPQFASTLRPMLEAGRLIQRAGFTPTEVHESQDRVRFRVAQAVNARRRPHRFMPRAASLVASLLVVFILMASVTSILAENSLPGDPLYAVKRLTEDLRLLVVNDKILEQQFAARRIDEIEQLLALNRAATVTFQGHVDAVGEGTWLIAGLRVQVSPDTPGSASARPGDTVEVRAYTTNQGQLVATAIRLSSGNEQIEPTRVPPSQVSTRPPTGSASPTLPATWTLTPTETPSATATGSPIARPTATPQATTCVPFQPQTWTAYIVQPDDTLSRLAVSTGVTLERLMRVNCLTNPNLVVTGQRLYLPATPDGSGSIASPEARPSEDRTSDNSGSRSSNSGPGGGDDGRDDGSSSGSDSGDDGGRGRDRGGG